MEVEKSSDSLEQMPAVDVLTAQAEDPGTLELGASAETGNKIIAQLDQADRQKQIESRQEKIILASQGQPLARMSPAQQSVSLEHETHKAFVTPLADHRLSETIDATIPKENKEGQPTSVLDIGSGGRINMPTRPDLAAVHSDINPLAKATYERITPDNGPYILFDAVNGSLKKIVEAGEIDVITAKSLFTSLGHQEIAKLAHRLKQSDIGLFIHAFDSASSYFRDLMIQAIGGAKKIKFHKDPTINGIYAVELMAMLNNKTIEIIKTIVDRVMLGANGVPSEYESIFYRVESNVTQPRSEYSYLNQTPGGEEDFNVVQTFPHTVTSFSYDPSIPPGSVQQRGVNYVLVYKKKDQPYNLPSDATIIETEMSILDNPIIASDLDLNMESLILGGASQLPDRFSSPIKDMDYADNAVYDLLEGQNSISVTEDENERITLSMRALAEKAASQVLRLILRPDHKSKT